MVSLLIYQLIAITFYLLFVYFSFCDGFNLPPMRKIAWGIVFIWVGILSLQQRGMFDLVFILPIPTALAMFLCWQQKKRK